MIGMDWGCPTCGPHAENRVLDTGHDVDGYVVRLRRCGCGYEFATEEVPIRREAFLARCENRRRREWEMRRRRKMKCRVCGLWVQGGSYYGHTRSNPRHAAALEERRRRREDEVAA